MTKEEKAELVLRRCEAKVRCKEVWATLQQFNRLMKNYLNDWERWNRRFEAADRKLAEVDGRLQVIKARERKPIPKLTKDQVLMITAALEQEMEGGELGISKNEYLD